MCSKLCKYLFVTAYDSRQTFSQPLTHLPSQRKQTCSSFCCHSTVISLSLSHLLQPCPSSSPCCWPASTAAVTPGSTCASPGICSRIWGRIFCAVPLVTSSPHPSATVSVTSTPVTRASPQTLPLRAQAVRGASHRRPRHKRPPSLPFLQLPTLPDTRKISSSSTSPGISRRGQTGKNGKSLNCFIGSTLQWKVEMELWNRKMNRQGCRSHYNLSGVNTCSPSDLHPRLQNIIKGALFCS